VGVLTNKPGLPKPAWVVENVAAIQNSVKRRSPSREPKAKRQRRDDISDSGKPSQISRNTELLSSEYETSPQNTAGRRALDDFSYAKTILPNSQDPRESKNPFQVSQPLAWDQEYTSPAYDQAFCDDAIQQGLPIAGQFLPHLHQETSSARTNGQVATESLQEPEDAHPPNGKIPDAGSHTGGVDEWNILPRMEYQPLNWDQDWDQILELGPEHHMPLNWDQDCNQILEMESDGHVHLNWDQDFCDHEATSETPSERPDHHQSHGTSRLEPGATCLNGSRQEVTAHT
jgi:hypothetical protein